MDYLAWHKIENANLDFLRNSLGIEEQHIQTIQQTTVNHLRPVYRTLYIRQFLTSLSNNFLHA